MKISKTEIIAHKINANKYNRTKETRINLKRDIDKFIAADFVVCFRCRSSSLQKCFCLQKTLESTFTIFCWHSNDIRIRLMAATKRYEKKQTRFRRRRNKKPFRFILCHFISFRWFFLSFSATHQRQTDFVSKKIFFFFSNYKNWRQCVTLVATIPFHFIHRQFQNDCVSFGRQKRPNALNLVFFAVTFSPSLNSPSYFLASLIFSLLHAMNSPSDKSESRVYSRCSTFSSDCVCVFFIIFLSFMFALSQRQKKKKQAIIFSLHVFLFALCIWVCVRNGQCVSWYRAVKEDNWTLVRCEWVRKS